MDALITSVGPTFSLSVFLVTLVLFFCGRAALSGTGGLDQYNEWRVELAEEVMKPDNYSQIDAFVKAVQTFY